MDQAWSLLVTAAAGMLGGGVGLKLFERLLDRFLPDKARQEAQEQERREEVRALMKDDFERLENYIRRLEAEILTLKEDKNKERQEAERQRTLADEWRGKYLSAHEQASLLTIQLATKDHIISQLQTKLRAYEGEQNAI